MCKLKYIIAALLFFLIISCRHLKWTSINGKLKETDKFWRYPKYSTSYTQKGRIKVVDTVENYLVSRTRYKHSNGCFHHKVIREKTIIYNKKHQRVQKVVIRYKKTKTIEYFNTKEEKIKALFGVPTSSMDSIDTQNNK